MFCYAKKMQSSASSFRVVFNLTMSRLRGRIFGLDNWKQHQS